MHKTGIFIKSEEIIYDLSDNIMEGKLALEKVLHFEEIPSINYLNSRQKQEMMVPVEIFSSEIAPLEALVKFSREKLKMRNAEISKALSRSPASVSNSYAAIKGKKLPLIKNSKRLIPLSIFNNSELSILECLVNYLRLSGISNVDISKMLHRDQRTIWTVHDRVVKKSRLKNERN